MTVNLCEKFQDHVESDFLVLEMNDEPTLPNDSDRALRIEEVIFEHIHQRLEGHESSAEDLIRKYPDLQPELEEQLRILDEFETKSPSLTFNSFQTLTIRCPHCRHPMAILADMQFTDIVCDACRSRFSITGDGEDRRAEKTIRMLGHFELVDRLGCGSFGTVWKARDTELDREVAIKIPREGQLDQANAEQFLREARAAAQLSHPYIVSVYEVGRDEDTLYIVSDLVRGVPLSEWLSGYRPTARESSVLCIRICEALQHAHDSGVIHRDLKPANIMIDGDGLPHLMDFGLARRDLGEVTMTVEGQILGTPAYMSPEQARGEAHRADRRSDIYSVGVIMFELLTGELPFRGNARMLLEQVVRDDAPRPRMLVNSIPRDLETICLKCLEKEPASRYQTATELSDELQRFRDDKPIVARPISALQRGWRWCRRNSVVALLASSLSVAILAIAIISTVAAIWQYQSQRRETVRQFEMVIEIARTRQEMASKLAGQRFDSLKSIAEAASLLQTLELGSDSSLKLRNDAIACSLLADFQLKQQWDVSGKLDTVAIDPEIKRYAIFDRDIVIRRLANNQEIRRLRDVASVESLRFNTISGRDSLVALHRQDGGKSISIWDLDNPQATPKTLKSISLRGNAMDVSQDGTRLAVVTSEQRFKVYDMTSLEELMDHSIGFVGEGCVFDPSARRLLLWGSGNLQIFDLETKEIKYFEDGNQQIKATSAAWSPNGMLVATGTTTHKALVWRVDEPSVPISVLIGHQAHLRQVSFLQNGEILATTSNDRTTRLWNAWTGEQLVRSDGQFVRFGADGNFKVAGILGYNLAVWTFETGRERRTLRRNGDYEVADFDISPDGRWLVSCTWSGSLLWDLNRLRDVTALDSGGTNSTVFVGDGNSVVTLPSAPPPGSDDPKLRRWPLRFGPGARVSVGEPRSLGDATKISTDRLGNRISAFKLGIVRTIDLMQPEKEFPKINTQNQVDPQFLATSPNARWIATDLQAEFGVLIWDVSSGDVAHQIAPMAQRPFNAAFSPDGNWLVVGTESIYSFYQTETWELHHQFRWRGSAGSPNRLEFSKDSRLLAISHSTFQIALVDPATGIEIASLPATFPQADLCFSPDGSRLFCSGAESTIEFWDLHLVWRRLEAIGLAPAKFRLLHQ